jgi:hypothetical protein
MTVEPSTVDTREEFVFTFGAGMRLRSTTREATGAGGHGIRLDGMFVAFRAANREEARDIMFAMFGRCWSFDYAPEEMVMVEGDKPPVGTGVWRTARETAGVERYGMRELDIGQALADLERERASMSPQGGPPISWFEYRERVEHDA